MTSKLYLSFFILCFTVFGFSQTSKKEVLFTVDGDPVMSSEFLRVYNKNLDLVKDESQKDIDSYLKLFINYQLKIKEAKQLKMDKDPKYIREFENYKKQLIKNYLSDNTVTETLVKEAYERTLIDVNATHILIKLDATEKDTLKVYNELLQLRNRALDEGFETVRTQLISESPKGKQGSLLYKDFEVYAEDLGYFSAFKMVYPFENAAYNTKVGEISMPFRTRFGYHITHVLDKRQSRGEVTVAHIMVSNNQKDSLLIPEVRINEIYKKIEQGEKFESLAKQFSDDKSSSSKGGLLATFVGGQLSSKEFEDMAFSLKEKNEISKPFKTDYGWHIVKLINKNGVQSFERLKPELEQKIKRDTRSSLINSALIKKLKTDYQLTKNSEAVAYFQSIIVDSYLNKSWVIPSDNFNNEEMAFKIRDKVYTYNDFGEHLMTAQKGYYGKKIEAKTIVSEEFKTFQEKMLLKYHEDNLEFENEEFGHILKEYRDGLLLFDLMENEVWNAASKDSVGLENYYNTHKNQYVWKNRVDAIVFSSASRDDISKVVEYLNDSKNAEDITAEMNTDKSQKVIVTKGIMELNHQALPKGFEFKEGVSEIYEHHDAFLVIDVLKVLPETNKTLEEARGKVVSDYQNFIEENWVDSLNKRYEVVVDQKVLSKIKSQILN